MATRVLTDTMKVALGRWREAFVEHWATQPLEFFLSMGTGNEALYRSNIGKMINPLNTDWFVRLVQEANLADLDVIERFLNSADNFTVYMAYRCFFLQELLKAAKKEHDVGSRYSEKIPVWFRSRGWNIGSKWTCEQESLLWGGSDIKMVEKTLVWTREYDTLRDKLKAARDAVRAAEEELDAHLAKKS
jgi:hypothetical protein